MEQFNLEKYLKNPARKVVTRDGRKVRILCIDAKGYYPIIALVENFDGTAEIPGSFSREGLYLISNTRYNDLFFAPEKHIGWINLFKGDCVDAEAYLGDFPIYSSKEIAECNGRCCRNYLSTIKIEWEE